MPQPLYPQEDSSWFKFYRRLGGSQSWSGRGGEEKNSQLPPEIEPTITQPVAQRFTTELSRLLGDNIKIYLKTYCEGVRWI
jgi:hypothetical protein